MPHVSLPDPLLSSKRLRFFFLVWQLIKTWSCVHVATFRYFSCCLLADGSDIEAPFMRYKVSMGFDELFSPPGQDSP